MLKKTILVLSMLTKKIIYSLTIIVSYFPLVAWSNDSLLLDKVVATVNQEIILHSEVEEACKQLIIQGHSVDESVKKNVLRELVLNKMLLAKAALTNTKVPETYIQRNCDHTIAQMIRQSGSEEKLVQYFNQPIGNIKKELKRRLEERYLAMKAKHNITEHIVVTPAEVQSYFEALPSHKREYYPASFEIRRLIIYPKVSVDRKEKAKQQLLLLKKQLMDNSATFADLAKQYSNDPGSASKGGEIGWMATGMLSPDYESAALKLKIGEISDPVASEFGLHLIQLIDRKKEKYNTRHILLMLSPTQNEIDLAKDEINKIREKIVRGTLTFDVAVKQYSEDKDTVLDGGLITANEHETESLPSTTLPADKLDPEIYFAVDGLNPGDISTPQLVNIQHRVGWQLLYLKQKVEPHMMNLAQDYEKIRYFLLQQKKNKAIHQWIQASKSAFIISFSEEYKTVEDLL
ncbi:peptidylprolyl isomerase [Cardinium endosymbiont of Culicoides punctatus]|uniref:peptidylprolyl isomerase n=1 Tax=Cardinium endosymbiont of Culicoides punctatus TaxID=2304601 RepID=UPI001058C7C0|nr:peptidylprolyl isomerase [Cardinium endosymbiont of Culicoides punctatus]TDG95684.1 Foldase protein PrsA 2 [Cardinium endosymbiont of Culicoides punctatus]